MLLHYNYMNVTCKNRLQTATLAVILLLIQLRRTMLSGK